MYWNVCFLGRQVFVYIENFSPTVPHLPAAVTLCQILVILEEKLESDSVQTKIHNVCGTMIKRKLCEDTQLKVAQINNSLQILLKFVLHVSQESISLADLTFLWGQIALNLVYR
jgi:hypothetical protein